MKTTPQNLPSSKLPKLLHGSLLCALLIPAIVSAQTVNKYASDFGSSQNIDWDTPGNWTLVEGTGTVPSSTADEVEIQSSTTGHVIYIDRDDIHLKLLEFAAGTTGAQTQSIRADGVRTLEVDTLIKNGGYNITFANSSAPNSLTVRIGDLHIETSGNLEIGHQGLGSLEGFTVLGTTIISGTSTFIYNGVKNRADGLNAIHLGKLHFDGAAANLTLGGRGNSNGTAVVTALSGNGIVQISNAGTHNGTAGTLHIDSANDSPTTFSGELRDYRRSSEPATLTVLKTGSGTQILSQSSGNTYSGTTTISEGVLAVANTSGSGFGTGSVEVNGSGVLAGSGRIAPGAGHTITVDAGGGISPSAHLADGFATLTLDGGSNSGAAILAMNEGSSFTFRLGAGNESDQIDFSNYHDGGLQLAAGGIDVNLLDAQLGEFTLFTFSSVSDFELEALHGLLNLGTGLEEYQASLSWGDNAVFLNVQAIPEPGETALLLIGLAGMAGWGIYRKRRKPASIA